LKIFICRTKRKKNNKKRTLPEHGLEPLAKIIMAQNNDVDLIATKYLNNNVINENCSARARDIVAEWINENIYVRKQLRRLFQRTATISTKVVKKAKEDEKSKSLINISIGQEPLGSKTPSASVIQRTAD
jgi:uncharacterized protein